MIRRFAFVLLVLVAAFGATGCSKKYKIHVESDTCWTGLVNRDLVIEECQGSVFQVKGKLDEVRVTKRTADGFVRAWIDDGRPVETSEAFGTITVRN